MRSRVKVRSRERPVLGSDVENHGSPVAVLGLLHPAFVVGWGLDLDLQTVALSVEFLAKDGCLDFGRLDRANLDPAYCEPANREEEQEFA
jgi:hypothetical protein